MGKQKTPMKEIHAFYSRKMDDYCGHVVYKNKNGEEIICTCVCPTMEHGLEWEDVEYMGKVLDIGDGGFVRSSRSFDSEFWEDYGYERRY